MTLERFQVTIKTEDNNPANYATNTWYMDVGGDTGRLNAAVALSDFYTEVDGLFGSQVAQNGHELKVYLMSDPEPRAPIYETTFNLATNPTSNPLPAEVALCLSFQAERESGESQARRRGRIYVGPLGTAALGADGRPAASALTAMTTGGTNLLAQSVTDTDWLWVIYSTVNNSLSYVDNGWVDNSFDTQRRRGVEYTSRSTFS